MENVEQILLNMLPGKEEKESCFLPAKPLEQYLR